MVALPVVDDVQDGVGAPLLHAVLDGGQVGRGVEEGAVLLLDDERGVEPVEKDADGALALAGQAAGVQVGHHAGQRLLVEALAKRVVELDAQSTIHLFDLRQTGWQETLPQSAVLRIAGMKLGRLGEHGAANVGVGVGQGLEAHVGGNCRHFGFEVGEIPPGLGQLRLGLAAPFGLGLALGGVGRVGRGGQAGDCGLLLGQFGGQRGNGLATSRVVVDQLVDQTIQATELGHGFGGQRGFVAEVLPPVDDHAELRAPVADVVVADHAVAKKLQHAAEGVADDGRANVPYVHRLGDIGRREVDHERARRGDGRHAEALVVDQRAAQLGNEPVVPQPQVDEPGPGDLGRIAQVGYVELGDNLGGHVARRAAQRIAQRHRAFGLVVAEFASLHGDHAFGQ